MPAWLASALSLLRSGRFALGAGAGAAPGFFGGLGGDGEEKKRRRRRRRALTASDRADIGFISGLLGPKAAKDFTVTLIAGLTR